MTLWKALKYHDKIRRPHYDKNAFLSFNSFYILIYTDTDMGLNITAALDKYAIFATDWEPYVDHKTAPEDQKP